MTNGDLIILPTTKEFLESSVLLKEGCFLKKYRKVKKRNGKTYYLPGLYNDPPGKIFLPGLFGTWKARE